MNVTNLENIIFSYFTMPALQMKEMPRGKYPVQINLLLF